MYKNDMPVFPKIIILEGRGNGKDGMMVPLANFFQTPLYGVMNYHVELVANSEQQIKDTFNVAYDVDIKPKFKGKFKCTKEEIKNLHNILKKYNNNKLESLFYDELFDESDFVFFALDFVNEKEELEALLDSRNETLILKTLTILKEKGMLTSEHKEFAVSKLTTPNIKSIAQVL